MPSKRVTPSSYNPEGRIYIDEPPDHPRGWDYVKYCRNRRYPKPFWEWLQWEEKFDGTNIRNQLRALADAKFCAYPSHKVKFFMERGVIEADKTTLFK